MGRMRALLALIGATWLGVAAVVAQVAPSPAELSAYGGLHAAAARGDIAEIERLATSAAAREAVDGRRRTALHVAIHQRQLDAARALLRFGADPKALDADRYDIVTIAAVANDPAGLKVALEGGGDPRAITSRYDGTALIAAAHLGHVDMVRALIEAGAPLDHVNNLGWTALIESIVLGDGGRNHTETLAALVRAGANVNIPDRQGVSPLGLARQRGFTEMVRILSEGGAR
jgi:hypothetical protein